jgi:putative membrane protein
VKIALYVLWLAGFGLFVALIGAQGVGDVAGAIAAAGWGLALVVAWHFAPMLADTIAWRVLLPRPHLRRMGLLVWMRWICESINTLLPVAQVGGDLVRARLLYRAGVPGPMAGASIVVDLTTAVLMQIAFALLGVGLLLFHGGTADAAVGIGIGIGVFGLLVLGFYLAQRAGMFLALARVFERMAGGGDWLSLVGSAARLDQSVGRLYRRRRPFAIACAWRFLAWSLGAGEVWLALHFLGHPVSLLEALMLESLGNAVRGAAFAVPGALGVQEGGFIILGSQVGLGAETSLALSLVKRFRELVLGLPGLAVWQLAEGRQLWRRGRGPSESTS